MFFYGLKAGWRVRSKVWGLMNQQWGPLGFGTQTRFIQYLCQKPGEDSYPGWQMSCWKSGRWAFVHFDVTQVGKNNLNHAYNDMNWSVPCRKGHLTLVSLTIYWSNFCIDCSRTSNQKYQQNEGHHNEGYGEQSRVCKTSMHIHSEQFWSLHPKKMELGGCREGQVKWSRSQRKN